jgi:protein-tyrosine phosphatase
MCKILMVCLGNICRSPLAQGILEEKAKLHNIDIDVDSAGTRSWHVGSLPDKRSISTAFNHKIDISSQKARKFNTRDFNTFDRIFVMDTDNLRDVLRLSSSEIDSEKVKLILNLTHPEQQFSVPDPYYGGQNGFEEVYQLLDKACDAIIMELKEK